MPQYNGKWDLNQICSAEDRSDIRLNYNIINIGPNFSNQI